MRPGWRIGAGRLPCWTVPKATEIMIYTIAAVSLVFVGYLAHDFYREQLRAIAIPVRHSRSGAVRKVRRFKLNR